MQLRFAARGAPCKLYAKVPCPTGCAAGDAPRRAPSSAACSASSCPAGSWRRLEQPSRPAPHKRQPQGARSRFPTLASMKISPARCRTSAPSGRLRLFYCEAELVRRTLLPAIQFRWLHISRHLPGRKGVSAVHTKKMKRRNAKKMCKEIAPRVTYALTYVLSQDVKKNAKL
jgi:hypothetical protein